MGRELIGLDVKVKVLVAWFSIYVCMCVYACMYTYINEVIKIWTEDSIPA